MAKSSETFKQSAKLIKKFLKDPKFKKYLSDTGYYIDYKVMLKMWKEASI